MVKLPSLQATHARGGRPGAQPLRPMSETAASYVLGHPSSLTRVKNKQPRRCAADSVHHPLFAKVPDTSQEETENRKRRFRFLLESEPGRDGCPPPSAACSQASPDPLISPHNSGAIIELDQPSQLTACAKRIQLIFVYRELTYSNRIVSWSMAIVMLLASAWSITTSSATVEVRSGGDFQCSLSTAVPAKAFLCMPDSAVAAPQPAPPLERNNFPASPAGELRHLVIRPAGSGPCEKRRQVIERRLGPTLVGIVVLRL